MDTPSEYDRVTAQLISDYLTLGMNHNTEDGLEAMARIISERDQTIRTHRAMAPRDWELLKALTQHNLRKLFSP